VEQASQAEKEKVVHIVRRLKEEALESRALRRRPWLLLSILACVALPTFVAALFYVFVAADRYVSEARFAVRSNEAPAADALGMITGLPSSAIVSDSYIVADYVISRDMVAELERRLPLRTIYADERADFFSRLDPEVTLEELVEYWQSRVDVYYDSTKNTIAVEVQAFSPDAAERIAREIVDIVRLLVNDLSAQARRDAVQFAAAEVMRAELRVRGARSDLLVFRVKNNELDPTESASATLTIAAELEGERSRLASQLASLSGYLAEDAPSIQMLKSRIAALDGEIGRIQGQISQAETKPGGPGPDAAGEGEIAPEGAIASIVGEYQELVLNQEFAETAYTAALGSLERARAEATRNQSYLAIYAHPDKAQQPTYPVRWLGILIVLVVSATLWAIGVFGFLTVKDHLP
jgi:capsular polysaccharide transport system permease protein